MLKTNFLFACFILITCVACGGGGSAPPTNPPVGDTIAPTVSITSPTSDTTITVTSDTVDLAGSANDNIGVVGVAWTSDRGASGNAGGTGSWSIQSIPLMVGDNLITITASDAVGLTSTDTLLISYQLGGVTVAIQSPTSSSNLNTNETKVVVAGTASSASGSISSVEWSSTQGTSGPATGTTSWTTPEIDVAVGSNTISISAQDDQGNSATDTLTVNRGSTGFAFVEGKDQTPPSTSQSEPSLGNSYVDPAYGLTVRKMTSSAGTRFNRNIYSRIQAENSNGTRFLTYHGDAEFRVYDRQTLDLVRRLPAIDPDAEIQWHPSNPNLIRYTAGNDSSSGRLVLFEENVTGATGGTGSAIFDLNGRLPWPNVDASGGRSGALFDGAEGSPSKDGNRYAWMVLDRNEDLVGIVAVDIATNTILGTLDPSDWAQYGGIDHVSMSPSGKYVIASFDRASIAYNANLTNPRQLHDTSEHSDIGIDAQGNDTFVIINFDSGALMSINLETGQNTTLFNIFQENTDTSIHISGKAFNKPGWAVVSTYNCRAPGGTVGWACNKIFAVELKANPRILNLAHSYNCGRDFWTETHAVPSRDLRRIYYNSDWGSCGIDAEVMQIDVPAF